MEEWKEYKLGEISTFSQGIQVDIDKQYSDYKPGRVRFIRIVDFTRNDEPIRFIDKPRDKCLTEDGDIVMIRYGSQTAGLVAISYDGAIANNIFKITFNNAVVSNEFGYYYLSQKSIFDFLRGAQSSSTMPAITFEIASRVPLFLPPIKEQERITKILKSLDDKIEVNRRINENLEQQAQALFKSWFVDFEPFKDHPFVESELGLIPQGWRVFELGEIARLCAGGDKPLLISKTISDACKVPIYSNGLDDEGLYGYTDEDRIKEKSITVSARGTIGDVNLRLEPYCPIVRLISVIPNNQDNLLYIYYALRNKKIEGVGTTQQQLTVPNFKKEKILLPDKAIIFSFSECLSPIINYKNHIKNESRRLAELRDTLLPRLMSGELKVSDVDA